MHKSILISLCVLAATIFLPKSILAQSVHRKTIIVCDTFTALLKCPPGTLIAVQSAFHGRKSDKFCATGPRPNYNCDGSTRALGIASARCNNRQSCLIGNEMFGDPCPGTYKYLELSYACLPIHSVVACDDEVLTLQCAPGWNIFVHEGFFGRNSDEHCARGPRTDYTCSHPNFKAIASDRCNNKQICQIQSSSISTDPCHGTFKYMNVAYKCIDHLLSVACDGQATSISCPSGKTIRVIEGFVGRNNDEFCAYGPRHTYECKSPGAHQAVINLCHNKSSCSFQRLPLPDPCPNTFKTTIVRYRCE